MKSYLITDPSFYNSLTTFKNYLLDIYQNFKIDYACYRDKGNFSNEYAKEFLKLSKSFKVDKVLLNTYMDEAKKFGFDGVHLTSKQFDMIEYAKDLSLFTVVSTHKIGEIDEVKQKGADAITFSPVFSSPNKGTPKGIEELKKAVESAYPMKCFALGGIVTQKEINECEKAGAYGFASIRYFTVK